ncbi:MAG: hypothetical protein KQH57_01045 [Actinomycetales bacterium]|nr:hypothetical protein [Actinomycetales bacterium]
MSTTTPAAPVQDPSLAALVPRPSPWRNAAAFVLGLALLVAVGVVGVQTRISLSDRGGGSSLEPDGRILEEHDIVATGWPGLTMTSVTPTPSTRLVDAWLVPRAARLATPDDSVAALVDTLEQDGAQYRLPRAVEPGLEYRLVLDTRIVSCASYAAATDPTLAPDTTTAADGSPVDPGAPRVHLRTALGTQLDAAVFSSTWSLDDLETYTACPD